MSRHVLIVGAGVGGLTTAALLAQQGYRVTVLEAQTYAGGSASTFFHKGYRFDSGATIAGGFQKDAPHDLVGQQLGIDWQIRQHEPAWMVHLPDRSIALTQDFADVYEKFPNSRAFWQEQRHVATLAWKMAAQGLPFPPQDFAEFMQFAKVGLLNFPADLQLLRFAFTPVQAWAKRHGLAEDSAFMRFLDASLLISAQNTSPYVNSIYGATALDLARQGVYHLKGGIGTIAETLVDKICELGGEVLYRQHVTRLEVQNGRVTGAYATKGRRETKETFYPADFILVNNTLWSLDKLLGDESPPKLRREVQNRPNTQGAFVLHLGVDASKLPPHLPDHHQIVRTLDGAMGEGETLYLSLSPEWDNSRAPAGQRAVTISTHTQVQTWWDTLQTSESAYYERKAQYTERLLQLIETIIPNFSDAVTLTLAGSPVTYQFYTMREKGMVGGFPQAGLFQARSPQTGIPNLRLVGDSIFPGQSTAGVTLGAIRVAKDVQRHLPMPKPTYKLASAYQK